MPEVQAKLTSCLGAVAILVLAGRLAATAQTYVITDLGTAGELESHATSINVSNTVVGYSVHSSGMSYRAWRWSPAEGHVELGGFGGSDARAFAINGAGQITGYATDASESAHGFLYDPINGLTDLGAPPIAAGVYPQGDQPSGAGCGLSHDGKQLRSLPLARTWSLGPAGHAAGRG